MVSLCPVWMPASPRSSEDRVLASEARCVGSNPAGGTITGSKFMHIFARFRKKDWGRRIGAVAVAMAMLALMAAAVACDPEEAQPTDAPPSATAVMPSPTPTQAPTATPGPTPTPLSLLLHPRPHQRPRLSLLPRFHRHRPQHPHLRPSLLPHLRRSCKQPRRCWMQPPQLWRQWRRVP